MQRAVATTAVAAIAVLKVFFIIKFNLLLYYLDEFYIEDECRVGRDCVGHTLCAVSEVARDEEGVFSAFYNCENKQLNIKYI